MPRALAEYIATSALRSSSSAEPVARVAGRHADADRSVRGRAVLRGAGLERLDQALGDAPGDRHLRGIPQEDGELVAADPGGEVARAQGRLDALADGREQLVAGGVAEGVVDDLEVVEIEEQDDRDEPGRVRGLETLRATLWAKNARLARPVSASW